MNERTKVQVFILYYYYYTDDDDGDRTNKVIVCFEFQLEFVNSFRFS